MDKFLKILKPKNKKNAFTLLELIVSIFVISVGILGAYILYSQIISFSEVSKARLTAAYLAQEGIEIVRNIRDTNWLNDRDQDYELDQGSYEADYQSISLSGWSEPGNSLRIDNNGFFRYSSDSETSSETRFKRKIVITPEGEILKVYVEVTWEGKHSFTITIQENLYNWYQQ